MSSSEEPQLGKRGKPDSDRTFEDKVKQNLKTGKDLSDQELEEDDGEEEFFDEETGDVEFDDEEEGEEEFDQDGDLEHDGALDEDDESYEEEDDQKKK